MKNAVFSALIALVFMAAAGAEAAEQYTCPMHPHYISSDPDAACPICGMDLVPMESGARDGSGDSAAIAVSPEMIQTMGVRTAEAAIAE